jgi:excisionase family DNA binding protein
LVVYRRININHMSSIAVIPTAHTIGRQMPDITTERDTGRRAHSILETCSLTGLGRDTIYGAIRAGKLTARKLGRRTLITDDDLRAFLAALPRAGQHEA